MLPFFNLIKRMMLSLYLTCVEIRASLLVSKAEYLDSKIIEYDEQIDDLEERIENAIIDADRIKTKITLTY